MWGFISYLNSPELVASFQRCCGLVPRETCSYVSRNGLVHSNGSGKDVPVTIHRRKAEQVANGTSRAHDSNSNYKSASLQYETQGEEQPGPHYEVRNWLFYFLFLTSATLGHEVFYITFLPCIHWNLDPFLCRRLVNVWAVVMYIGQVMKDILKLPRPPSPPVVKLETRVDAEYGMPSTHAMAVTAISFTLLLSAQERVKFPFELGLIVAVVLSALVCLSRLYTGMHSALDVICGVVISAVIMAVSYPYWGSIDYLQLHNPLSPVVGVVLPLFLSYKYPELDHYSTTRGDTTIILACCSGCSVGYWVNERLGLTFDLAGPFPVTLPPLTLVALGLCVVRFLVGLGMLVLTRQTVRWASLRVLCRINGASVSDVEARRRKEIEVPYKFSTYVAIGLVNSILVNRVYVMMGLWDLGNSV
ncbi:sphingosine-1-phosphate phosphatase 2-like [Sinocyclocheilus anshuiensis]|uniref:Sphingosine-1-phosphate phosphatase 2-like n=1 Tax=Sinocyclocheilus anshuiensis TaxID=1608454 RepID=A0A671PFW6_9TELE|nr:PREDICTED: sphingosine-1-phosphate phosphatase 2-like [Sinocyclocheilus anshuiensis]